MSNNIPGLYKVFSKPKTLFAFVEMVAWFSMFIGKWLLLPESTQLSRSKNIILENVAAVEHADLELSIQIMNTKDEEIIFIFLNFILEHLRCFYF